MPTYWPTYFPTYAPTDADDGEKSAEEVVKETRNIDVKPSPEADDYVGMPEPVDESWYDMPDSTNNQYGGGVGMTVGQVNAAGQAVEFRPPQNRPPPPPPPPPPGMGNPFTATNQNGGPANGYGPKPDAPQVYGGYGGNGEKPPPKPETDSWEVTPMWDDDGWEGVSGGKAGKRGRKGKAGKGSRWKCSKAGKVSYFFVF